jgi:hypothetical protein
MKELFRIYRNPPIITRAPAIIIMILLRESVIKEKVMKVNPFKIKYAPITKFIINQSIPKLVLLYCPFFSIDSKREETF